MEILFLGTSSGTPTKARNVSALALRSPQARAWYLVDCGEGTQHQLLHAPLSLLDLAAIFITHIHGDHCYGLPGLLASAGMLNRTQLMTVAGPPAVRHFIEGVMETTQLRLPYPVQYIDVERSPAMPQFKEVAVQATALSHRVPSYGYSFSEKGIKGKPDVLKLKQDDIPPGPAWNQIQQGQDPVLPNGHTIIAGNYLLPPRKPRKIIVGGDNDTPALLAEQAVDADVLVHEATYTQAVLDRVGAAPQHSSAKEVARFAQEIGIPNLVLTHFSPRYHEQALALLEAEARSIYKGRLFLANDGDRYSLDKQGQLSQHPLSPGK
jgi:ribonuclease Z